MNLNMKAEKKRKREQKVVEEMISLYCRKNHRIENGELCGDCRELVDYAKQRSEKCPFMANKTFCGYAGAHKGRHAFFWTENDILSSRAGCLASCKQ